MMEGGLSDAMVARLRRLDALDLLGDSDAAASIRLHLRRQDEERDDRRLLDAVRLLQAFINPVMYAELYKDDIEKANAERRPKQVRPKAKDMDKVRSMLKALSNEDAGRRRRQEWMNARPQ